MAARSNYGVISLLLLCTITLGHAKIYYKEEYLKVPLDHFSFSSNVTFNMKYLINDTYWKQDDGAIFFYTGNEGEIELFAEHTGFIWENAEEFKALIVFAEHRYYGASLPFGNKSFDDPAHLGYLTSAQALSDYVDLITVLQKKYNANDRTRPVIAFGGSYGGMLSTYIRLKYPHIVAGAIAASAPIHQFSGMIPCDAYYRIASSVFDATCRSNVRKSWAAIRNKTSTAKGKLELSQDWKLCKNITDDKMTTDLIDFLSDMYTTLAMVNYPFPCTFMADLPAYPVRYVCQNLNDDSLKGDNLLKKIQKVVETFTNFTGKAKCVDFEGGADSPRLGTDAWDYQACTEMVMPMCTTGTNDMFEPSKWDTESFSSNCIKKWKVAPKFDQAQKEYGGMRLDAASNIVFSNGLLDPWTSGGILRNIGNTVAVLIPEGAHHLDLMPSTQYDPTSVRTVRMYHKKFIKKWISEYKDVTVSNNGYPFGGLLI